MCLPRPISVRDDRSRRRSRLSLLCWLSMGLGAGTGLSASACAPPTDGDVDGQIDADDADDGHDEDGLALDTTPSDVAQANTAACSATSRVRSFSFAPRISSDCRALAAPAPSWHERPHGDRCEPGGAFWLLSATDEDIDFRAFDKGSVRMSDVRPRFEGEDASPWNYGFYALPSGRYRIGWALDKLNFPTHVDRHTGTFVNDSFDVNPGLPRPTVADHLYVEMDVRLRGEDRGFDDRPVTVFQEPNWDAVIPDPAVRIVGEAKNRITVGVSARSVDGTFYYLEVNLFRTKNWDFVDDAQDVLDRAMSWDAPGISRGQIVYFNGEHLSRAPGGQHDLPTLSVEPDGAFRHFLIPVSDLFEQHPWPFPTDSWANVEIAGIYFGAEIWGRGRLWFEVEGYRLFSSEDEACP
ncbi:MAG: hypothetical protein IPK13_01985 [Deltaproteobacteria bacterium]|nr:hypothetical protein [Deltaproteobacteria bacterium]